MARRRHVHHLRAIITHKSNIMKTTFKDFFTLHFVVLIFGFTAILGQLISIHTLSLIHI
jgi:hypothetical protein